MSKIVNIPEPFRFIFCVVAVFVGFFLAVGLGVLP